MMMMITIIIISAFCLPWLRGKSQLQMSLLLNLEKRTVTKLAAVKVTVRWLWIEIQYHVHIDDKNPKLQPQEYHILRCSCGHWCGDLSSCCRSMECRRWFFVGHDSSYLEDHISSLKVWRALKVWQSHSLSLALPLARAGRSWPRCLWWIFSMVWQQIFFTLEQAEKGRPAESLSIDQAKRGGGKVPG